MKELDGILYLRVFWFALTAHVVVNFKELEASGNVSNKMTTITVRSI
jgi:hypothetical protein